MELRSAGVVPHVRRISRSLAAALVFTAAAAAMQARPTDILPAGDLTPGMKGYGFSDLGDGKGVQRFDVEIIGLLKSYAPKQDLILARVMGGLLDQSGIIAGMIGDAHALQDKGQPTVVKATPKAERGIPSVT